MVDREEIRNDNSEVISQKLELFLLCANHRLDWEEEGKEAQSVHCKSEVSKI